MSLYNKLALFVGGALQSVAEELGVEIRVQHEDIFNSMHRI